MAISDLDRWFELSDGVNTIKVTLYEALDYSQTYEIFGGSTVHRMLDGSAVKQTNWRKLRTTLSGNGGIPLGMSALDYTGTLTLKCGVTRSISSVNNIIPLPVARRIDTGYTPSARKIIDGIAVPTTSSLTGDTLTVTVDPLAQGYIASYFPELVVTMNDPSETFSYSGNSSGWSIIAEEV